MLSGTLTNDAQLDYNHVRNAIRQLLDESGQTPEDHAKMMSLQRMKVQDRRMVRQNRGDDFQTETGWSVLLFSSEHCWLTWTGSAVAFSLSSMVLTYRRLQGSPKRFLTLAFFNEMPVWTIKNMRPHPAPRFFFFKNFPHTKTEGVKTAQTWAKKPGKKGKSSKCFGVNIHR